MSAAYQIEQTDRSTARLSDIEPTPNQLNSVASDAEEMLADKQAFVMDPADESGEPEQQLRDTSVTTDPVKDWLKRIAKIPLLNAEKEVELAVRIEAGVFSAHKLADPKWRRSSKAGKPTEEELEWFVEDGIKALNHLIEANQRLVVSLAKRYTGRGMQFLDLIQEGNFGLIRAAEKFDNTKGYKFSTYATWWIRQAITRAMADQSRTIRIPVHMVEVMNQISRVERQILQDEGHEPTPEEVAKELDMPLEKVLEVKQYGKDPISFSTPLGEDGDGVFGDLIEDATEITPVDAVGFTLLQEQLRAVLGTFSDREADIINMRFGLTDGIQHDRREIGAKHGVSAERIRQLEVKIMSKLRHPDRSKGLRDYLDDAQKSTQ